MNLVHPGFDPVLWHIAGPLAIRWYGLMYLAGFVGGWWLGRIRARQSGRCIGVRQVDDLVFYLMLGVILGGRIGSTLFYHFPVFIDNPLMIIRIWDGGMSFHGGLLGVLAAMWLYCRKHGFCFFDVTDFIAPLFPLGLGAGRLGNFINQELVGHPTDMPWGMIFPKLGDNVARHPSQLYQLALEGVVMFIILWWFSARSRPRMMVSALFLMLYGLFRFTVEFAREPDAHLGFIAFNWLTMGQLLSIPMLIIGIGMFWLAHKN